MRDGGVIEEQSTVIEASYDVSYLAARRRRSARSGRPRAEASRAARLVDGRDRDQAGGL